MSTSPHPDAELIARIIRQNSHLASAWSGDAFRSAEPRYATTPDMVTGIGSARSGGRWNPRGSFNTVYASLDPETAMSEALASYRYYGIAVTSAMPRLFRALEVRLSAVLDLRDARLRTRLAAWPDVWSGEDWRAVQDAGDESASQAIGRAAYEAGLEGLLVPSHAAPAGANIVAFPGRFRAGSVLRGR